MVEVKIQKRPTGNGRYFSYVITLPISLVESVDKLKKAKKVDITLKDNKLILTPK